MRDPVDLIRRTENPGRVSEVRWRWENAHGWRIFKDWCVCHLIGDIEEAHANKFSVSSFSDFGNVHVLIDVSTDLVHQACIQS